MTNENTDNIKEIKEIDIKHDLDERYKNLKNLLTTKQMDQNKRYENFTLNVKVPIHDERIGVLQLFDYSDDRKVHCEFSEKFLENWVSRNLKNIKNLLTTKQMNIKQGLNILNNNKQKRFYEFISEFLTINFTRPKIDPNLLQHDSEKDLLTLIFLIELKPFELQNLDRISQRMEDLSDLGEYVDAFFENVRVETDSPALTQNRKNILRFVTYLFDDVADFSKLKHG